MKSFVFCIGMLFILLPATVNANYTHIDYALSELGQGTWKYSYEITSQLTPNAKEFTIYFDYGLYSNLKIESVSALSTNWDQIVVQPSPAFGGQNGFFDFLATDTGIAPGTAVAGFAVSFQWLGMGLPAAQSYQVINPVTFATIESGQTVPEPIACSFLLLGSLWFRSKNRKNCHK